MFEMADKTDQIEETTSNKSDDDEVVAAEPLATTRSRRSNAGNRMSKMIQDEEDEFYSNLYGGFHEEEDDDDFDDEDEVDDEEVEDDYDVDSDFSIDETDEIAPEHREVDEEPKKKSSKAYKDPKPKGYSSTGPTSTNAGAPETPVANRVKPSSSKNYISPGKNRAERSFRDSTRKKTEETNKNIQTGSRKKKKMRNMPVLRRLTQEEMLEEARLTEEENIKSLEIYQRLESEKLKKLKQIKKTLPAPYVTYWSTVITNKSSGEKNSRNFLTFIT